MAGISIGNRFPVNPVRNDLVAAWETTGSLLINGRTYRLNCGLPAGIKYTNITWENGVPTSVKYKGNGIEGCSTLQAD
jgi:hypothetical protein